MNGKNVLEAVDLYKFYHASDEETLALRGVNLIVPRGQIIALKGPSGSGKSTFLSCVSGIIEPDGGYVKVSGIRITRKSDARRAAIRAAKMGIMLQSDGLFDQLTVRENLIMKMWLAGNVELNRIPAMADALGISGLLRSLPSRISGGEASRAALALALITNPDILIADEPTGEVDAETEKQLIDLFEAYRKQGGTALIATHSDSLARIADRIVHLRDGRIIDEL